MVSACLSIRSSPRLDSPYFALSPLCRYLHSTLYHVAHIEVRISLCVLRITKGTSLTRLFSAAAGEEVLATYGAHSNDKLLVHYGFILSSDPSRPNSDDDIRLDHLILPQLDASLRAQLQDVGYLGSYALLPASNELCFKTQVAIRAILQTCNEWEYFVACGEDLTTDCTVDVEKFVEKLLREWRSTALMGCAHEGMLGLRWKQIVQAIDAFTAP